MATMVRGMGIITPMAEPVSLTRLFSWLSPAFPIGGFAYSQGLETLIADGSVSSADTLRCWIEGQLHSGPLRTDAYFLAIAAQAVGRNDPVGLIAARDLALALQVSSERHAETTEQARSFLIAVGAWPVPQPSVFDTILTHPVTLPVAVGTMIGLHGIDLHAALCGFINSVVGQQISVAIRLVPLGQTEGLKLLAALEPGVESLADAASTAQIEDIASMAYGVDIASLRHEDLDVRIFRS